MAGRGVRGRAATGAGGCEHRLPELLRLGEGRTQGPPAGGAAVPVEAGLGPQSIRFTRAARFRVNPAGRLRLPGIGDVPVRWSRSLPGEASSVTVTLDAAGRYHASFVVEVDDQPLPSTDREVGIDLGLTHFAVLSDGRKVDNPRIARKAARQAAAGTAGAVPPTAWLEEPGHVGPQGRTVSCPSRGYSPGLAAQAVNHHRSGEPTDRGGRPRRVRPGPHPARPQRARRGLVDVRGDVGVQGTAARAAHSSGSTAGSPPPGRARRVGPSARPSPCMSGSGPAPVARSTTGSVTAHARSGPRDARTVQRSWSCVSAGTPVPQPAVKREPAGSTA